MPRRSASLQLRALDQDGPSESGLGTVEQRGQFAQLSIALE
jgi:hypothetical protein